MCPSIEIDDQVLERLKEEAEPFVDTPNSVLRRVLGLAAADGGRAGQGQPSRRAGGVEGRQRRSRTRSRPSSSRAPMGSLLPESEYEIPILRALAERGGSAPARDVLTAVGEVLADRLTALDREEVSNGGQRWQSRVQFTRLRLRERGLIKSGSPRGLWELSTAGIEELHDRDGGA